jgi:ribosomal protein S6E (S10)
LHKKFKSENENALMASMKVSYRTAREGEERKIGGRKNMISPVQFIWLHVG